MYLLPPVTQFFVTGLFITQNFTKIIPIALLTKMILSQFCINFDSNPNNLDPDPNSNPNFTLH